jgi:hypothetical protein
MCLIETAFFSQVVTLSNTAQVIVACRETREISRTMRKASKRLRSEAKDVAEISLGQRTRSRIELEHKVSSPWKYSLDQ